MESMDYITAADASSPRWPRHPPYPLLAPLVESIPCISRHLPHHVPILVQTAPRLSSPPQNYHAHPPHPLPSDSNADILEVQWIGQQAVHHVPNCQGSAE